jgi:pumilio family protein 6
MLRSATASDVLFETCSGGAGGAVAVAVGDAQMRELHDAVAEAARASVAGENLAENLAENPAGARDEDATLASGTLPKALPLHEDYFSTRALRRMVLEIPGNDDRGVFQKDATRRDGTPPSFAAALWEGAVSRDVAAWIGGHGAKVVAAIVKSGDAATRKACIAALTKALPKGQSPTTWAEGFFRQRAEGTKETKETKETKKAPETKARASSKTPAPEKKTSKSADENAATPSAARVSKSPKDKKFSPRLTRAQRSEKAAKGKK